MVKWEPPAEIGADIEQELQGSGSVAESTSAGGWGDAVVAAEVESDGSPSSNVEMKRLSRSDATVEHEKGKICSSN